MPRSGHGRPIPLVADGAVGRQVGVDVLVRAQPATGNRLVSFFATARLASRSDRGAFVDTKFRAGVVRVGSTIRWTGVPIAMASLVTSRCRVRF